jgi:hypothetical protein
MNPPTEHAEPDIDGDIDGFYPEPVQAQPFGPAFPICWATHTPEEQQVLLEELDVWVTWLTEHYHLDRRHIPECWTQHWELVEELSALRLAWDGAYATSARSDAPLTWHDHFHLTRTRLTEWVARTGCRPGEHRPLK